MWTHRGQHLAEVLVDLADAAEDVTAVLHDLTGACVDLLGIDTAGLLLADEQGELQTVASTHERTQLLELFQLQTQQGPCVDCFNSGHMVVCLDLIEQSDRWPAFSARARIESVRSVYAIPLRSRGQTIGGLNLFRSQPGPLPSVELGIAGSLATAATIGIQHTRDQADSVARTAQLQGALNSRVIIEQAKGVLAERHQLPLRESFERLRRHARSNNLLLADVAREVVAGFDPAEPPRPLSNQVSAPRGRVTGETNRDVRTDALGVGDEEIG
jgi:GAF domain-containing protein